MLGKINKSNRSICRNIFIIALFVAALAPFLTRAGNQKEPIITFIQISDTHVISGKSVETLTKAIEDINSLEPLPNFVVITGDLINGENPVESTQLFKDLCSQFRCPFFPVFGNHDNRRAYTAILWEYNYSFDIPPYHFITLDNIELGKGPKDTYGGRFSERTVNWLKEHLRTVDKQTPLIFFSHASIYRDPSFSDNLPGDVYNYEPVVEMLRPYNVIAWISGHSHKNDYINKDGVDYITTGCLSDHRDNHDSPDGYRIVRVYQDRVESFFRPITEFASPCRSSRK